MHICMKTFIEIFAVARYGYSKCNKRDLKAILNELKLKSKADQKNFCGGGATKFK